MKQLLLLFGILGAVTFIASIIASSYSREKRSISRYSQVMKVIDRVASERSEDLGVHKVEPSPHIRLRKGDDDAPPSEVTEAPQRPTYDGPVRISSNMSARIARNEFEDIKLPVEEVTSVEEVTKVEEGSSVFREVLQKAARVATAPSLIFDDEDPALDEVPSKGDRGRGPVRPIGKSRVGSLGSPLIAGSAALVIIVIVTIILLPNLASSGSKVTSTTTPPTTVAKKATTASTTTTAVPQFLSPTSSDASGASFAAPTAAYTVVITVNSGACWVAQSTAAGAPISWDGTLSQGQTHTFQVTGPLWVRAGNSGVVALTINGVPVHFTASPGPYNFQFVPTAGSSI